MLGRFVPSIPGRSDSIAPWSNPQGGLPEEEVEPWMGAREEGPPERVQETGVDLEASQQVWVPVFPAKVGGQVEVDFAPMPLPIHRH